jgi:hypothetical protein
METDNNDNIRTFTATDIEKYHRGQLSPRERHALEKAALDDPFLADALEGYAVPGVDRGADLANLQSRLAERTGAKVVTIGSGKTSFPWLRAAIAVGVLAGASLLTYQFFFTNKNGLKEELAQSPEAAQNKQQPVNPGDKAVDFDSARVYGPGANNQSGDTVLSRQDNKLMFRLSDSINTAEAERLESFVDTKTDNTSAPVIGFTTPVTDTPVAQYQVITPNVSTAKPKEGIAKADDKKLLDGYLSTNDDKKSAKRKKEEEKEGAFKEEYYAKDRRSDTLKQKAPGAYDNFYNDKDQQRGIAANSNNANLKKIKSNQQGYFGNTFNGRVTDASNNGLPFANVMNTRDNVGTYTDVNGRFTLTSPDSVLNVQIRSTGFDNNVVNLRSTVSDNQVVMEEDRSVAAQTLQGPRRVNSEKRRTLVLEGEPEPEDGWENYDSYLSNNVNIPDAFKPKSNTGGQVEVSFEVNEDGEPIKIRVEKSLCRSCDKEAIRLIKEGPRWKRKARKGRTTVTISF